MTQFAFDRFADRVWRGWYDRIKFAPLWVRRGGALAVELSLIVGSAIVPYQLGVYARDREIGQPVPVSPLISAASDGFAIAFGTSPRQPNRNVSPLTNLFWTGAIAAPLLVGAWQLYRLSTTGLTDPKRWFGVRVVGETGQPCGVGRIVLREAIGRWGVAAGLGYGFWLTIGAYGSGGLLLGIVGMLALADSLCVRLDRFHRTLHDRLAGTHILDMFQYEYGYSAYVWPEGPDRTHWTQTDPDEAIEAIVLLDDDPFLPPPVPGLWPWMRSNPITTLGLLGLFCIAALLGTLAATQVYVQQQTNQRQQTAEANELYISLVDKLAPLPGAVDERKNAILALGTLDDDRVQTLLVDLLAQETDPVLIDALQQALVSRGTESIDGLRRLNQGLRNELEALENTDDRDLIARRLQATQQAIAKIAIGYSGEMPEADLSRTDLGRNDRADFTLVLSGINLAGSRFRGSILRHADFQQAVFFSPGQDDRAGSYDDAIADLSGADLSHANFAGANLERVWLRKANLMRTNFNDASLQQSAATGANFSSTQAIGASFRGSDLERASFTGADLKTSDFRDVRLQDATLSQADLAGALLAEANLVRSNWQEADLSGADLSGANLRDANLSGAILAGATLAGADLRAANFAGADVSAVDWRRSRLAGANFQDAIWTRSDDTLAIAEADEMPWFDGVDFSETRGLDREALTFLCQQGAKHPDCP
ncbi:MAG: pentapeptide repeat-containing protein [Geitlerinemataceae cyanobacterium]